MAVRKKVRTVTMLETDGRTSPVTVTTTYLNSLKSLKITFEGERSNMYFEWIGGWSLISPVPSPGINHLATNLAHDESTTRGVTRSNQLLRTVRDRFQETVVGTAYLEPLSNRSRYARVVSIKPIAPLYTPNVIADTRNAFTEWAADQFPAEYRPVFLYDHRGCFVACEHPDETVRNAWLVASRLRWG